ncbi:DUF2779 domain-containing protein [Variovorax saccharolyticus]|uniref:DUF2779 domain-containing protein n=1 Tax=Variovorax saccharolyticus TaxID=3053516 RepID=UPI00257551F1|nr:DUF2779 domain-containing protein [Variovorax sp. J31P216]MDM0029603.1 DUF2779 domain-containing protein [Variovorax sp. J31P216]
MNVPPGIQPIRYLTKSRFKAALECPTKLFYGGKPEYLDSSADNEFLAALAEGGFQVGALACLMYPGGVEVTEMGHAAQLERTRTLLRQDDVTIYEAALEAEGLFVRVDVLRKRGGLVELIEVKAKSFDPAKSGDFRDASGRLRADMLPYLRDIAFQCHVARLAFPEFTYCTFLMLTDKSATSSVDGLNQRFKIRRTGRNVAVEVAPGTNAAALGAPILRAVPVDIQVAEIVGGTLDIAGTPMPFAKAVQHLAAAFREDRRIAPRPGGACGACEFKSRTPPMAGAPRSGFHECWSAAFGWSPDDFAGGTVLDLWNHRGKDALIERGVRRLRDVVPDDLEFDGAAPGALGLERRHRQWYQCVPSWPGGGEFFIHREGLRAEMGGWRYPLHFIDFETSAVAVPFTIGQHPYETVAFQFSHHVLNQDGRVEHRSQFLEATPGRNPSLSFLRALKGALSGDDGTVFRWATHENTVLNELRRQLQVSEARPGDAQELIHFVESITTRTEDRCVATGPRNMLDLCKLAERFYFHPSTGGSSSLKKVLPALMRSSPFLRARYGQPIYGSAQMPSLNWTTPVSWWVADDDLVRDPYDLLPSVFGDIRSKRAEEVAALEVGVAPHLQHGGSAMAAYGRLQFEEIDVREREAIENALLRYCELDTLAMVMAVEAWKAWVEDEAT